MPEFTDTFIDESNLDAFRRYFFGTPNPSDMSPLPKITGRDTLRKIIGDAPKMSDAQQKYLGRIVAHSDDARDNAETLIDMADRYPVLFSTAYGVSGDSVGGFLFNAINDQMNKNTFDKNVPAIYALVRDGQSVFDTGRPSAAPLSAKNAKYINEIFRMSTLQDTPAQYPAARFLRDVALSDLVNMDGATDGLREFINAQITNTNPRDAAKYLGKLDRKFFTPQLLADVISKHILEYQTKAKPANLQELKNAAVTPAYYKKTRDALVELAGNEEIHDRENHGAEKSLSRRYREMVMRMTGAKNWAALTRDNKLVRDAALTAAQRDIMDGNAELLDDATLRLVLGSDKNNAYLRKIPVDIIESRPAVMNELNPEQRKIIIAKRPKSLGNMPKEYILNSSVLSHDEKSNFVKTIAANANKQAAKLGDLKSELAQYDAEWTRVRRAGATLQTREAVAQSIDRLQRAFRRITDNLKNGVPNRNEAHLAPDMIEARIRALLFVGDRAGVGRVAEYGLPLFGRGAERTRRENLNAAIDEFNRTLRQIPLKADATAFKKYDGQMLVPDSLTRALGDIKIARVNSDKLHQTFIATHRNRAQIDAEIKNLTALLHTATDLEQTLHQRARTIKELAAARMAPTNDKLVPVTPLMTGDEKRAVRAANKTKSRDKLADKAKNKNDLPRRVAQMLNNMGR